MKPSQEFTIKVLSPEDYEMLPYPGAKDSYGMAVMKTKTAYVRKTGIEEFDRSTLEHEFDELMAATSEHEIDGIRYKSGGGLGKILGPIVGTIVGVVTGNPMAGAAVAAAIGGGTQAHSQSVKPEKYGCGFGGIAQAGLLSGLGGYGGASLINAGRVAATNAAIASGATGNTAAILGAGIKGAVGAATSGAGSALLSSGKSAVAGDTPYKTASAPSYNYNYSPNEMVASPVTAAFAPQAETYLSESDYNKGLSNITSNMAANKKSVVDLFRGQSPSGNSAYSLALQNAQKSGGTALSQFKEDQRKLGSPFAV